MHPDAAPRARVSLTAIVENVVAAAGPDAVVDLRRDARGHGADAVADALLSRTDVGIIADPADVVRWGSRSPRVRGAGRATISPAVVFGAGATGSPAMSLVGRVLGVKVLRAGEGVSYGYTYRAPADTWVALVTGGYAQGIPRSLGNRAEVTIGGRRHPIVGRVAMDVCVVAIGEAAVTRGAAAVFFGDPLAGAPGVTEWAAASRLTPLELVTAVGLHTQREHRS
jgi:alanine racemase